MKLAQKLWKHARDLFPTEGFYFDRPVVLLQSDDWGRVGLRDKAGLGELELDGLRLGERPYDFYTLETAEDLAALSCVLNKHSDSSGRHPSLQMNFIVANLDFSRMSTAGFRELHLLLLADGLPEGWDRPGLIEAYRRGITEGLFHPALHGITHFCRPAVERHLTEDREEAKLLRRLWRAGTPYIHWRMPWIGYEYWEPERPEDDRFLPAPAQEHAIGQAVGAFAKLFSAVPRSACAPGYRANADTHRAWAQHGIHVAQSGPGDPAPPHFDEFGLLHVSRTVEFEPATDDAFSVESSIRQAEACFTRGMPATVSIHAINFHSSVRDFRTPTLNSLDVFLTALESRHPNLIYLHDEDLYSLARSAPHMTQNDGVRVNVISRKFTKKTLARQT
jgi:hypothetical protein